MVRCIQVFVVLCLVSGAGVVGAESGQASLDNDFEEMETFFEDDTLAAGEIVSEDTDQDGDFDTLGIGIQGGGGIFGWTELDGRRDNEIIVADPTLEAGKIRRVDVDGDGDVEVVWVGTQGSDWDQDGKIEPEEQGAIIAVGDIDGDGNFEILVNDTTLSVGDFFTATFGLNHTGNDPLEVVWVGVMNDAKTARGASVEGITNRDGDGDIEVVLKDLRTRSNATGFGQFIDIDQDGDPDLIIE